MTASSSTSAVTTQRFLAVHNDRHQYPTRAVAAAALGVTFQQYKSLVESHSAHPEFISRKTPLPALVSAKRDEEKNARRELEQLQYRFEVDKDVIRLYDTLKARPADPPRWLTPTRADSIAAIATLFASDWHLDEVVDPVKINGVNAYDRDIATRRAQNFFSNGARLVRDYVSGVKVEGLVLAFGGDMLSGMIHEELVRSNAAPIMQSILYWRDCLIAGINQLREQFKRISIFWIVGNHGRMAKKPQAKFHVHDNYEWLLGKLIETEFAKEPDVFVSISDSTEARWQVYGVRYHMTHGDQFRGGSGIAGILSPIMLGDHRKRARELATGTPYDVLIMGHWHQYTDLGRLVVNGSLKGYDEWAASMNFGFEPPQQAFWLTDPKWGRTVRAPIHVLSEEENHQDARTCIHTVEVG